MNGFSKVGYMNSFNDEQKFQAWTVFFFKTFFEEIEQINTLNISIKWTDFNYERFPPWTVSSSNKFENKRIPTLNILKKRKVFPMLVIWMDFHDEQNANHERIPSRNKFKNDRIPTLNISRSKIVFPR
jgi:hypothetical protein